jgi:hypothetical protein
MDEDTISRAVEIALKTLCGKSCLSLHVQGSGWTGSQETQGFTVTLYNLQI